MNRQGFIGGSDMNVIMNKDWHELWLVKTGKKEPEDLSDNLAVQLGSYTEQFNIDWFAKSFIPDYAHQSDFGIKDKQHEFKMLWEDIPLKGTVDAIVHPERAILECKHTNEHSTMESCLRKYMPQIQFYMWLAQSNACYLSVIFGNKKWECVHVSFDEDYLKVMQQKLKQFWLCVTTSSEPYQTPLPVSIDTIPVDNMVRRDATGDNQFISLCYDYINSQDIAQSFEKAKSQLKEMVGDNEREVYCDLLSIKRDKRGSLRIHTKQT